MAKETTTKLIVFVILAALIVLSWGIAFGGIKEKVKNVGNQTIANKVDIRELQGEVSESKIRDQRIEGHYAKIALHMKIQATQTKDMLNKQDKTEDAIHDIQLNISKWEAVKEK